MVKTIEEKRIDTKIKKVEKTEKKIDKQLKEIEEKEKKIDKISSKFKKSSHEFKIEFKKAISTAIIAAFSFIIALSWRDVIASYIEKLELVSPLKGEVIGSLIVTIISVIGILIVTKFMSESN